MRGNVSKPFAMTMPEKNDNGTETGKNVSLVSLRAAILQLGYSANKMGYKFTEIEDAFELFQVAQKIWQNEIKTNTPGFTQRDFPIILSPAATAAQVDTAEPTVQPEEEPKSKGKKSK